LNFLIVVDFWGEGRRAWTGEGKDGPIGQGKGKGKPLTGNNHSCKLGAYIREAGEAEKDKGFR